MRALYAMPEFAERADAAIPTGSISYLLMTRLLNDLTV